MNAEIITIADERFETMAKVALMSLHAFSDAGDAPMAVYDFGLSNGFSDWADLHSVQVRSCAGAPRALLPVALSGLQRRFDLWVCKAWAMQDAAKRFGGDTIVFFDSDMIALKPMIAEICEATALGGYVATLDPFTFGEANIYATPENAKRPEFWIEMFGKDLTGEPTVNIGLVAANVDELRSAAHERWIQDILNWGMKPECREELQPLCIDQLIFSALTALDVFTVRAMPPEFNLTRPLWTNRPELIPAARAIHLTGPIKPWEPGGAIHPMTITWRHAAYELDRRGLL
jgi:hypothetical protein